VGRKELSILHAVCHRRYKCGDGNANESGMNNIPTMKKKSHKTVTAQNQNKTVFIKANKFGLLEISSTTNREERTTAVFLDLRKHSKKCGTTDYCTNYSKYTCHHRSSD